MAEKILIIDDDVDTLKLVGLMLERQGYEIAVATNGSVGISKARVDFPDLILLDVMMPDLDGFEVTRRLKADPTLAHIPIIMFTAKTMVDDKVAGFEAGVDDYLTKPTHPAELAAHVKAVLTRSAQSRITPSEKASIIGFLGTRGGIGTSTLALNVCLVLREDAQDVEWRKLTSTHSPHFFPQHPNLQPHPHHCLVVGLHVPPVDPHYVLLLVMRFVVLPRLPSH